MGGGTFLPQGPYQGNGVSIWIVGRIENVSVGPVKVSLRICRV
jgi:hypothetical protein